jgi:hypothetical protein
MGYARAAVHCVKREPAVLALHINYAFSWIYANSPPCGSRPTNSRTPDDGLAPIGDIAVDLASGQPEALEQP